MRPTIDQFQNIKIQSQTIDLRARLWGINTELVGFIPQSLVLRSIYCLRLNFNISKLVYSSGHTPTVIFLNVTEIHPMKV